MQDRSFNYDIASARTYQTRGVRGAGGTGGGVSSPFSSTYVPDLGDDLQRYATPSYSYSGSRYYHNIPSWAAGYSEDGVDYSGVNYTPQYYGHDPSTYLYRMTSGAKAASTAPMYGDMDTGYIQRSAGSNDSPNFSLSTVAASLPPTVASNERLLPTPVTRSLSGSGYRADGSAGYSKSTQSRVSSQTPPSVAVSVSDVSANYTSYDGSPASPYPSSSGQHPSISNGSGSSGSSHQLSTPTDVYSSSSSQGSSIFSDSDLSLRNQGSSAEFSYKYTDSSTRGSGNPTSTLSNGQTYTVPQPPVVSQRHQHALPGHPSHVPHQHHYHVNGPEAVSATAYMMSGSGGGVGGVGTAGVAVELSGATAAAADAGGGLPGAGGGGGGDSGSSATRHPDVQRHARTAAGSLSAT